MVPIACQVQSALKLARCVYGLTNEWSPPSITGSMPASAWLLTTPATDFVTRETVRGFFNLPMGGSSKLLFSSNWWWPWNTAFQPSFWSWSARPAWTRWIGPSSTPALGWIELSQIGRSEYRMHSPVRHLKNSLDHERLNSCREKLTWRGSRQSAMSY